VTGIGNVYPTAAAAAASGNDSSVLETIYQGWQTAVSRPPGTTRRQTKRAVTADTTTDVPQQTMSATQTTASTDVSTSSLDTATTTADTVTSPASPTASATSVSSIVPVGNASCTGSSTGPVETDGIAFHKVYRQTQLAFSEVDDQTEYGNWYYMTANTSIMSHQSGEDSVVRGAFAANGVLADTDDVSYRAINDSYPVFAYALDFGCVGTQNASALFTISLNQQDAVQFEGANGNQTLPSLWTSYFGTDLNANTFFYNDYDTASTMATSFDNQVASDSAAAAGSNYTTITSLATRQAFGALQLVNTPDTPYMFMKEISSDGNIQTVDVIFPFHPIVIYANPTLLKLILEPLFINQEAGNWPYAFSIHDIGTRKTEPLTP